MERTDKGEHPRGPGALSGGVGTASREAPAILHARHRLLSRSGTQLQKTAAPLRAGQESWRQNTVERNRAAAATQETPSTTRQMSYFFSCTRHSRSQIKHHKLKTEIIGDRPQEQRNSRPKVLPPIRNPAVIHKAASPYHKLSPRAPGLSMSVCPYGHGKVAS